MSTGARPRRKHAGLDHGPLISKPGAAHGDHPATTPGPLRAGDQPRGDAPSRSRRPRQRRDGGQAPYRGARGDAPALRPRRAGAYRPDLVHHPDLRPPEHPPQRRSAACTGTAKPRRASSAPSATCSVPPSVSRTRSCRSGWSSPAGGTCAGSNAFQRAGNRRDREPVVCSLPALLLPDRILPRAGAEAGLADIPRPVAARVSDGPGAAAPGSGGAWKGAVRGPQARRAEPRLVAAPAARSNGDTPRIRPPSP